MAELAIRCRIGYHTRALGATDGATLGAANGATQFVMGHKCMIKLLMTWDIKPDREAEYMEFIMREFGVGMIQVGLQPTDAWYTMYGQGPQVLAGGVTETLEKMYKILSGKEWQELEAKLLTFVDHYRRRIVEATGGFQL